MLRFCARNVVHGRFRQGFKAPKKFGIDRTITTTVLKKEHVPTYGFIIGACALCFQIGVLFPWHDTLSKQFEDLEVYSN